MTLLNRHTSGVYAIAPTPFLPDGSIDFHSLTTLLSFYEGSGVDGVTILGQLGEATKLTAAETTSVVSHVLSSTTLPIIVGVTSPGFAAMKELTAHSMNSGAAGVMIAPPNTLRTDDQLVTYFRNAAQAVDGAPFVLQDYPLSFSVVLSEKVIELIAVENDNFVMLKHEDWPGLDKISGLREREKLGTMPRLSILCGNGGLFLDFEMERGADGAMTGYCFPELLVDIVRLSREGRREDAHDLFDAHLPLIRYEQQPALGLAVRKSIMVRRGLIAHAVLRTPAPRLTEESQREINLVLERLGRFDSRAKSLSISSARRT